MATITSASTVQNVLDTYMDNLSYSTDESETKAKAFIEACRAMLHWPEQTLRDSSSMQLNHSIIAQELSNAEVWRANANVSTVKHVDFKGFRS